MKQIQSSDSVAIPDNVTVSVSSRVVCVTGPRGKLRRDFKHLHLDIRLVKEGKKKLVKVELWFGNRKEIATIRTVCTHIKNMIVGVTKGYEYKMRFVYAHFPINANVADDGKSIEIRNFLGEHKLRAVPMLDGVTITRSDKEKSKDEIVLVGNDLELVSQSAANIHMSTLVKEKDIRKFLDGIYVSEKGVLGQN